MRGAVCYAKRTVRAAGLCRGGDRSADPVGAGAAVGVLVVLSGGGTDRHGDLVPAVLLILISDRNLGFFPARIAPCFVEALDHICPLCSAGFASPDTILSRKSFPTFLSDIRLKGEVRCVFTFFGCRDGWRRCCCASGARHSPPGARIGCTNRTEKERRHGN